MIPAPCTSRSPVISTMTSVPTSTRRPTTVAAWRRIDEGIPEDTFVRVVREDPDRKGLLFAGTEAGMFVSFNDGGDWQPLELNLPPVPITDLTFRQNNLVAATQGRGFWVLDDLFVVRQASADIAAKPIHVYRPHTTHMLPTAPAAGAFEGKNPSRDVPFLLLHSR